MKPIFNKMIPNRKVKIRLVRDDFSSPILGNVWMGRECVLNISTARRFVDYGYAEFVDENSENKAPHPDTNPPGDNQNNGGGKVTLFDAIMALNPDDDAHWTKGGQPDLNVLKEITGSEVKRKEVETAAPDFNRDAAKAAAAKE